MTNGDQDPLDEHDHNDPQDDGHGGHHAHDRGHGHGGGDDRGHGHDDDHDHHGHDHHHAHDVRSLTAAVLTVSSTRTLDDDPAGDTIDAAFTDDGHEVAERRVIPDDHDEIQETVEALIAEESIDVVVTTGGTGITPDDVTVEAIEPLFEKELPGFGELFRALSRDEIGTRVVGTRATAGVRDGAAIFCLPGSENAARLGATEIIVPEAPHLVGLASRDAE